jgi:hypothetical protein
MLIDESIDELLERITSVIYILGERMSREELKQKLDDAIEDALSDLDAEGI